MNRKQVTSIIKWIAIYAIVIFLEGFFWVVFGSLGGGDWWSPEGFWGGFSGYYSNLWFVIFPVTALVIFLVKRRKVKKIQQAEKKVALFSRLFKMSSRVKIDDMVAILGMPRAEFLAKLLEYSDKYRFKIEEDVVVFEPGANPDELAKKLDSL